MKGQQWLNITNQKEARALTETRVHIARWNSSDENEFYAGAANRNRQEFEDGGMIHEDNRAIANLPQEVMIKDYPKIDMYMPGDLNDGISGIDREGYANSHIARRQLKPRKA